MPSRPSVSSASVCSLTAASNVRPATTCIRSTPRVVVVPVFSARMNVRSVRSSASKYRGNESPAWTSSTSSSAPCMTCANAP